MPDVPGLTLMLDRSSFEALDGGMRSVSLRMTQEFHMPLPMEDLLSPCADLVRLVARSDPDFVPWYDGTVELGVLLPHQTAWSPHRFRIEDLPQKGAVPFS